MPIAFRVRRLSEAAAAESTPCMAVIRVATDRIPLAEREGYSRQQTAEAPASRGLVVNA